ncbi:MAG: acyl-CoA dehydrogenase family protein [Azoarcus sp.]|jgi:alkylation response protein AidB-like acyl-CoA dehydrogenase|nr:acyl-CoA dehydrogenase family protein [Azoarcus sp.]
MNENEDYAMVREQAQRFLNDAMDPEYLRALLEAPGSFDGRTWASVIEFGWPAIAVAEEHDGLGLGWRGLCVLAEESGRKTASLPLVPSAVAAQLIFAHADRAVHQEDGAALVSGARYACLALARTDDAGLADPPELHLRGALLHGTSALTPFAASADYALVAAQDGETFSLLLVALAQPAVSRTPSCAIDNSRAAAELSFDGARVRVLATGNEARTAFWRAASLAALATAFEQIGGAQTCLEMARDYALERKAFGQPIGRFQAIKGKLADMYIRIELARGCALDALAALEQGDPSWLGLAASARVAATDAYEVSARENIQTHGAIGVTWEALPHHHYRRSRALGIELGAAIMWRERLLAESGFASAA